MKYHTDNEELDYIATWRAIGRQALGKIYRSSRALARVCERMRVRPRRRRHVSRFTDLNRMIAIRQRYDASSQNAGSTLRRKPSSTPSIVLSGAVLRKEASALGSARRGILPNASARGSQDSLRKNLCAPFRHRPHPRAIPMNTPTCPMARGAGATHQKQKRRRPHKGAAVSFSLIASLRLASALALPLSAPAQTLSTAALLAALQLEPHPQPQQQAALPDEPSAGSAPSLASHRYWRRRPNR